MNAMAAQGALRAAPPLVIEDHRPAQPLEAQSRIVYVKWGAGVFGLLLVGFFIGGITYKNQVYNETIDDAKLLKHEVNAIGKGLENLNNTLLVARERGPNKQDFLVGDAELTAQLAALKLTKPAAEKLYLSNLLNMDPRLAESTLGFYTDIEFLYDKVARHVRLAKADVKSVKGNKVLDKLGGERNFGGVLRVPKDDPNGPPTVEIVEIGAPVCSDNQPHTEGCPDGKPPAGFQFRPDIKDATWGSKAWAKSAVEVNPDNLILLGETSVFRALVKGGKPFYGEVGYVARIHEIEELAKALIMTRKAIEDRLNQKAIEGKRFSL